MVVSVECHGVGFLLISWLGAEPRWLGYIYGTLAATRLDFHLYVWGGVCAVPATVFVGGAWVRGWIF